MDSLKGKTFNLSNIGNPCLSFFCSPGCPKNEAIAGPTMSSWSLLVMIVILFLSFLFPSYESWSIQDQIATSKTHRRGKNMQKRSVCFQWHGTNALENDNPEPAPGKTCKWIFCALLRAMYRHLLTKVWHCNICSSETLRSTSRSRQERLSLAKVATAQTLIHPNTS